MSITQVMSLEYAIAVYPLLLIIFTFLFIKLHEKFEVVQIFSKPAVWLFTYFNHQWRASNSLIEAFGTFLLLSYVKIINTSFDILMPVQLHNVSGKVVGLYTYYNGSLEYFGQDHLPYAVLAIFMFFTFNLVPLLLFCLYPCRCFQSCLNCCRLNSQVLRTFMDAFQGCYKFEPYDCRYWAAFYLFLRIVILAIFALTQSGYLLLVSGILIIPVVSLLAVVRPYRQTVYNVVDIVMFLTFIQMCFSAVGFSLSAFDRRYEGFVSVMFGIALMFLPTYAIVLAVKNIIPNRWIAIIKKHVLRALCRKNEQLLTVSEDAADPLLQEVADSTEA